MMNFKVNVYPVEHETLRANVSINIDDVIVINDFKLVEGKNGMFISSPSRAYKDGRETKYKDVAYFLDQDVKDELLEQILTEYAKRKAKKTRKK